MSGGRYLLLLDQAEVGTPPPTVEAELTANNLDFLLANNGDFLTTNFV